MIKHLMNPDFISTVPKVTATLLGFAGAMFVFWFHYRYNELLKDKNQPLLKLFITSFIFIFLSGLFVIIYSMQALYEMNIVASQLFSSLFWIFLFSLSGFFMLIVVDIIPKK